MQDPNTNSIPPSIDLTQKEKEIFELLIQVVQHANTNTTLRVAGGWVRDKVLGQHSDDIDIALDNLMGKEFAELVNRYLTSIGQKECSIGVIQSNPEQSKHLETATMKLNGIWIDFVNLRTEEYTDTRIPIMKIGTPEEDALRRDLTINSLFYNINESKVEDLTGKGISDLKIGLVRTPLPPLTTFLDDPLRVLRAIRFASRLHFQLDSELCQAVFNPEVKKALEMKVSRERIGKELNGMFQSEEDGDTVPSVSTTTKRSPVYAFKMMLELELIDTVFKLPEDVKVSEGRFREKSLEKMGQMQRCLQLPLANSQNLSLEAKRHLLLAGFFYPLVSYTYMTKKKKPEPVIKYVILESLKLPLKDADVVYLLANGALELHVLLQNCAVVAHDGTKSYDASLLNKLSRVDLGLLIRKVGSLWRDVVLLSLSLDLPPFKRDILKEPIPSEGDHVIGFYQSFFNRIEELGLSQVYDMKPLLNGTEVQKLFGKTGGPWLGKVMDQQVKWQLDNPEKGIEECKEFLLRSGGNANNNNS